ncbi:chemotaxis protein CheW [Thermosipho melanesiensis]|uniref:Chemotaxis protein CheW n=2 Tax=Thermosipho melanesiensis TaxID=46541 RepID=A0ABM6GCV7_9BACT|nr:chemotaxis protein CheW [Thermosipho melanesiensis]ABR30147.1 putative CheW protein [Thermosipho melanesiensis BI429]APT73346.1 chemotaxis protein CheW [Thermosipho melanesiensis]OOC38161.1 chemotaxis protein CheW [Thermosipho melanesiensis]OOC40082.1 chemotaxis protein CheW [Thermosipho melanesiensis]OOC40135.1 chemotaxis protein CheW [Thermosipho melanesiensis]
MELKVLTFMLGDEEFAIDIMKVDRVKEYEKTTKLPNSLDFVEGIINLMGEVIPIINLRKKFMLQDFDEKEKTKIIVIRFENEKKMGFLVDDVKEVITLSGDQIDQTPEYSGESSQFLLGVAKLEDRMILILDVEKILKKEEKIEISNMVK